MPGIGDVKAGGAYVEITAENEKLKAKVRESEGILEEMKAGFGRGSKAFELIHTLEGAGAAAGLTLGAKLLGEWAEKAGKIKEELEAGKIGAGEATDQFVRALPVLGEIYSAGRSIRDLFTGDESALRGANEELKIMGEFMETIKKQGRENEEIFKGWETRLQKINEEAAVLSLPKSERDLAEKMKGNVESGRTEVEAVQKKARDDKEALAKEIAELRKQRDAINPQNPGAMPSGLTPSGAIGDFGSPGDGGSSALAEWQEKNDRYQRALARQRLIQSQINDRSAKFDSIDPKAAEAVSGINANTVTKAENIVGESLTKMGETFGKAWDHVVKEFEKHAKDAEELRKRILETIPSERLKLQKEDIARALKDHSITPEQAAAATAIAEKEALGHQAKEHHQALREIQAPRLESDAVAAAARERFALAAHAVDSESARGLKQANEHLAKIVKQTEHPLVVKEGRR